MKRAFVLWFALCPTLAAAADDFAKLVETALKELRAKVEAGEISFRVLSLAINDLKLGQVGVGNQIVNESRLSRPLLFRDIPGGEELVPKKSITITVPVIVSGRQSDAFVLESFAAAVKRVRATGK